MKNPPFISGFVFFLFVLACGDTTKISDMQTENDYGFPLSNLDSSVLPCENFYQYAVGGWLAANPVPATESKWSSFNVLNNENLKKQQELLEELMAGTHPPGSQNQLVADMYRAAMDSSALENVGLKALQPYMDKIAAIKQPSDILQIVAEHKKIGSGLIFSMYVHQDSKNSEAYITYLGQGGLGLPEKDYYFPEEERGKNVLEAYKKFIREMFVLAGLAENEADNNARYVMQIETALAEVSLDKVAMRDPEKTYNKLSVQELQKACPQIDWTTFFRQLNVHESNVVVNNPAFITQAGKMLNKIPIEQWQAYITFHLLSDYAPYVSAAMQEAHFNFFDKVLWGRKEMKPRWKRSLEIINSTMGEAMGKLYVEKHFSESSKKRLEEMVENIREVYKQRILQLDWMSDSTKQQALAKLEKFNKKIGYPDKWKDYQGLHIEPDKLAENVMRCRQWGYAFMVNKLGKPLDRSEWFMTPQTVNAYYSPSMNEIVFPAAILQPPFFNPDADDAINYGGIGAVIGHEFTHGFDDQGAKFDGHGNMHNWWSEKDKAQFTERTDMLVEQFNSFEPVEKVFVNGELTLGENIADLGGLVLAYYALEKAMQQPKAYPEKIQGFTYRQRFFLGWAQVWHATIQEDALVQMVKTDPHSPSEYRVNGPLSNLPEFHAAFGCKPGQKMVRSEDKQIKIW